MWAMGYHMSVAAAIGFIALAGVAAETGIVMLIYLDQAWQSKLTALGGQAPRMADLASAIVDGAVGRVRPKMMTVVAIMAGLLPIMWSTGAGSEVMRRIAAPICQSSNRSEAGHWSGAGREAGADAGAATSRPRIARQ